MHRSKVARLSIIAVMLISSSVHAGGIIGSGGSAKTLRVSDAAFTEIVQNAPSGVGISIGGKTFKPSTIDILNRKINLHHGADETIILQSDGIPVLEKTDTGYIVNPAR